MASFCRIPQDERFGLVSPLRRAAVSARPISPKASRVTLLESSYSSFRTRKDLWPSWRHTRGEKHEYPRKAQKLPGSPGLAEECEASPGADRRTSKDAELDWPVMTTHDYRKRALIVATRNFGGVALVATVSAFPDRGPLFTDCARLPQKTR